MGKKKTPLCQVDANVLSAEQSYNKFYLNGNNLSNFYRSEI